MGLRRSAIQISIVNAVSVVLGFAFHILLGRRFGISWELDCLFISLTIFSFFGIFNALLITLLTPVFNEIKTANEREGFEFADVVFKWSFFIGIVIWVIILYLGYPIIKLFASGFDEKSINLSRALLKILFPGFVFYALSVSVTVILNSLYFFMIPALAGLLNPIFNIMAIFILTPEYGVKGIAVSYLFSNAAQAIILMSYAFVKTQWRPTLKIYHKKLPDLLKHSSTAVAGNFIWSIRDIVSRNIASHLGSGAIALLSYADKIISVLAQTVITPVSGVFYSKASRLIAIERWNEIKDLLLRVTRAGSSISIFVSAGVIVFLKSLLSLLFLDSKFTGNDIHTLSFLMIIELIYLIVLSFELFFVRVAYAAKMPVVALFNAIIGVALFYVFSVAFSEFFGIYGLALSMSIAQIPVCMLYFHFINKKVGTEAGSVLSPLIKNLLLAAGFIVAGLFVNSSLRSDMHIIFLWGPVWTLVYLAVSRWILEDEWNILRSREA